MIRGGNNCLICKRYAGGMLVLIVGEEHAYNFNFGRIPLMYFIDEERANDMRQQLVRFSNFISNNKVTVRRLTKVGLLHYIMESLSFQSNWHSCRETSEGSRVVT